MNSRSSFTWVGLTVLIALILTAGLSLSANAVDQGLTVRAGVIVFNRPVFDTVSLVEFPFVLTRDQFDFYRPDSSSGALFARIFAQVNVYGADGRPVDSANTYFSAGAVDSIDALRPAYSLFNSLVIVARPGIYSARVTVIDVVSKRQGECFLDRINVEAPVKDRLSMGGKCLAFRISYVGEMPGVGVGVPKNGYEVRCNPTGAFSTHDTTASYYAEVYNLKYDSRAPSDFVVTSQVLDDSNKVFRELGGRPRAKAGTSAVIAESFSIAGWLAGRYDLQVTVADRESGEEVSYDFPFIIVAPQMAAVIAPSSLSEDADPCAGLDLETQRRLVYYLLTSQEKDILKGLTPDGQRLYIERYWQERDPDVTTRVLENRQQMYEHYLYANNFFSISEGRTDGWFTDRGRVFMVYGQPDKIEDFTHPSNEYPYQVWWYYSLRDGSVFVFQDSRGFGDFKLVHSSYAGELYNKVWDQAIRDGSYDAD